MVLGALSKLAISENNQKNVGAVAFGSREIAYCACRCVVGGVQSTVLQMKGTMLSIDYIIFQNRNLCSQGVCMTRKVR